MAAVPPEHVTGHEGCAGAGRASRMSPGALIGVIGIALLALGGGAWWLVKRRGASSQS
jgi:hypothetical protein